MRGGLVCASSVTAESRSLVGSCAESTPCMDIGSSPEPKNLTRYY